MKRAFIRRDLLSHDRLIFSPIDVLIAVFLIIAFDLLNIHKTLTANHEVGRKTRQ